MVLQGVLGKLRQLSVPGLLSRIKSLEKQLVQEGERHALVEESYKLELAGSHAQLQEQCENFLAEQDEMKASYATKWKGLEQKLKGMVRLPCRVGLACDWGPYWRECCVDAEAELAHTWSTEDALSWKNVYHQEQANCEKLSKLVQNMDVDYKKALALNRDMGEALAPVVDTFVPLEPNVDPPSSFLARTGQLADKINEYLQQTVRRTVGQLLASVQAFNPTLNLEPVGGVMPDECS
jgi:hypothetical protein